MIVAISSLDIYGGTYEQKSNNENTGMATNVTTKFQAGSDKCVYTVNHIFACSRHGFLCHFLVWNR